MKELREKIQKRFDEMCATGKLFRSSVTGAELWEQYISGFENDPVFRDPNSSEHNCNLCKHFICRYGNIIAFDEDYNIMTIWDVDCDEEYKNSLKQMSDLIKLGFTANIFIETLDSLKKTNYGPSKANQGEYKLGNEYNIKRYTKEEAEMYPNSGIKENDVYRFEHLALTCPGRFVDDSGESIEMLMSKYRSKVQVFQRGLNEIPLDTLYLVRDLEAQGSLLNGISYNHIINRAIKAKEEYDQIPNSKKAAWVWVNTRSFKTIASFRNTAIGTLMVELSEGKEINEAVKAFNKMVDPVNYMKATAPITKAQIAQAEKFVEENGYTDSFERRCATIDDIIVSDILHSNMSSVITKVSIFDKVKSTTRHKRSEFDNVEEVSIEKFMQDILPNCTSVEVYLSNKHKKNFVNLLTSVNKDSKNMFKWNNNFSWTYNGNLAGKSEITEAVKAKGGCVDAPLRCSIIWNENRDAMYTDFDNHCYESNGDHICYMYHRSDRGQNSSKFGGYLDIDITNPASQCNGGPGVENIYYPSYKDGTYEFRLHNFNGGNNEGGRAEIYFEGTLYQYEIKRTVKPNEYITLAKLHIKNHKLVKIEQGQYFVGEEGEKSTNIYGLDTNQFHKVNLVCLSPNYWQGQGVGNKHYFFMLEGAQNPDEIRSIHNEFLNDELRNHRKVMEVLGTTLKVESTKGQLCGLGFNSTVRDEVILRLGGSHKRVIKVKF